MRKDLQLRFIKNNSVKPFKSNITPSNIQNASDFYNNVKVSKDYDAAEHIRDSQFNIINQVKSWLKNIR